MPWEAQGRRRRGRALPQRAQKEKTYYIYNWRVRTNEAQKRPQGSRVTGTPSPLPGREAGPAVSSHWALAFPPALHSGWGVGGTVGRRGFVGSVGVEFRWKIKKNFFFSFFLLPWLVCFLVSPARRRSTATYVPPQSSDQRCGRSTRRRPGGLPRPAGRLVLRCPPRSSEVYFTYLRRREEGAGGPFRGGPRRFSCSAHVTARRLPPPDAGQGRQGDGPGRPARPPGPRTSRVFVPPVERPSRPPWPSF